MIVKNKKTGLEYEISAEQWETLKHQNKHRIYDVVDTKDFVRKTMPAEITEIIEKNHTKPQKNERSTAVSRDKTV